MIPDDDGSTKMVAWTEVCQFILTCCGNPGSNKHGVDSTKYIIGSTSTLQLVLIGESWRLAEGM